MKRRVKSVNIHECKKKEMVLCRSMVCTISDDGKYVDVVWEMDSGDSSSYLVAPKLETTTKAAADTANTRVIEKEAEDVYEDSVPVDQIQPLLPFENRTAEATTDWNNEDDNAHASSAAATNKDKLNNIQRILLGKQQGDDLLTLRDPYAAIERYEQALFHSSKVEVGGTIILNRKGYPTIAHVDCIDQDQLHVAILHYSGSRSNPSRGVEEEEIEISSSKVLLALLVLPSEIRDNPTEDDTMYLHLQERILLNLARCFLMIVQAENEGVEARKSERMTKYLQASVLACTLALSCLIASNYDDDINHRGYTITTSTTIDLERKARFLRASAYLQLHKLHHAMLDVQYVLSKEAKVENNRAIPSTNFERLKREIHYQIVQKKQLNKQLTKDMCQWLQEATKNM
jgi:hypothetical protein